jgi:hypothetical protein
MPTCQRERVPAVLHVVVCVSCQAAQAHSREPEPPSAEELRGIKPRGDGTGDGEGAEGQGEEDDDDDAGPTGKKPETAAAKFMREREIKRASLCFVTVARV